MITDKCCFICGSILEKPVCEETKPTGLAIIMMHDGGHILCSMCTSMLCEIREQLKRSGKALIVKSQHNVISVTDAHGG